MLVGIIGWSQGGDGAGAAGCVGAEPGLTPRRVDDVSLVNERAEQRWASERAQQQRQKGAREAQRARSDDTKGEKEKTRAEMWGCKGEMKLRKKTYTQPIRVSDQKAIAPRLKELRGDWDRKPRRE